MKTKKTTRWLLIFLCILLLGSVPAYAASRGSGLLWEPETVQEEEDEEEESSTQSGGYRGPSLEYLTPEEWAEYYSDPCYVGNNFEARDYPLFDPIEFPAAKPYTQAEAAALNNDEPWTGLVGWPAGSENIRVVLHGYLCAIEEDGITLHRIDGTVCDEKLRAAGPTPTGGLCLLDADGNIWFTDINGQNEKLMATLPGIKGKELRSTWTYIYTDGEVVWFVYGKQVARVYLPTGRVDSGTLADNCRMWRPVSRSKIYCQYLLENERYQPDIELIHEHKGSKTAHIYPVYTTAVENYEFSVRQSCFDMQRKKESTVDLSQLMTWQQQGQLFRYPQNNASVLTYTQYFAGQQTNHAALAAMQGGQIRLQDGCLYVDIAASTSNWQSVIQLWSVGTASAKVDHPLNGRIKSIHWYGGSLYLWASDNRLYRCTADDPQQLVADFNVITAAAQLPSVKYAVRFDGPFAWVQANDQPYRIYLPGGEIDVIRG